MKADDLTGSRSGRLTVVKFAGKRGPSRHWECRCDCGATVWVTTGNFRAGHVRSCGCLRSKRTGDSRLYRIWYEMKAKCRRPSHPKYAHYGQQGINYDPSWESFEAFEDWARQSGYRADLFLTRISPLHDFSPATCSWSRIWRKARRLRDLAGNRRPILNEDQLSFAGRRRRGGRKAQTPFHSEVKEREGGENSCRS
jgi:hypothetical protein